MIIPGHQGFRQVRVTCVVWPGQCGQRWHTGAGAQVDHVCFGGSPVQGKRENLWDGYRYRSCLKIWKIHCQGSLYVALTKLWKLRVWLFLSNILWDYEKMFVVSLWPDHEAKMMVHYSWWCANVISLTSSLPSKKQCTINFASWKTHHERCVDNLPFC